MTKKLAMAGAVLLAASSLLVAPAQAAGVKIGVLTCRRRPGLGLCRSARPRTSTATTFRTVAESASAISARITKIGVDIGYTARRHDRVGRDRAVLRPGAGRAGRQLCRRDRQSHGRRRRGRQRADRRLRQVDRAAAAQHRRQHRLERRRRYRRDQPAGTTSANSRACSAVDERPRVRAGPFFCHICIVQPSTPMAAWRMASVSVGCAWLVRAMSSEEAENSIASDASPIMLPTSGPIMWTPSTRSVLASAMIFTNPSVVRFDFARAFAVNGKLADLVGDARGLQLLFGFPDRRDFGIGVDHRRDGIVIHVARAPGDELGAGDRFVLGLVRQHRAFAHVADRPDARNVGLEMRIRDDAAALVALNADLIETKPVRVRPPADGDEDRVGFDRLARAALRPARPTPTSTAPFFSTPTTLLASLNFMPCRSSRRWNCFAISLSMPGTMRSRNSTTVTSDPSRRHTEPSSSPITPAPITSSRFGAAGNDSAPVDDTICRSSISTPGQRRDIGTRRDDDVLRLQLAHAVLRLDAHFAGRGDLPLADDADDLVLLEQELDALGQLADHLVLVRHHRCEIDAHASR